LVPEAAVVTGPDLDRSQLIRLGEADRQAKEPIPTGRRVVDPEVGAGRSQSGNAAPVGEMNRRHVRIVRPPEVSISIAITR